MRRWLGLGLLFGSLAAVLLWVTPGANVYDGPLRLAGELVRGRTHLPDFVGWLEMFRHDGRDYLAYPPMVSFVLVPYVLVTSLGQPLANTLFILGSAVLLFRLMRTLPGVEALAGRAAIAYAIGTPVLYSASWGDVWGLMHSEGNFFLFLTLFFVLVRRHLLIAGFFFMVAMQTRYSVALASLTFGLLFLQFGVPGERLKTAFRSGLWFTAGAVPALAVVLLYQWWTLGDPLMSPYSGGWREWGLKGPQFDLKYFWNNLPVYTYATPTVLPQFPYLRFDASGQSIFVLSPFFLGVFLPALRRPWVPAFLVTAVAMQGFYLVYFGTGFAQFGARYMQDAYPLLLPVAFSAFGRPGRGWRIALDVLLVYSVLMVGYGVYVTRFLAP
ncbi:MAG: hypothetical protein P8R42_15020 [Candidatus Binatia bacterium]|nr:hypothetical protein [Candidatus Binatia bacterium]